MNEAHGLAELAQFVYDGNDCCFALHDALIEAGCPKLAEHFACREKWTQRRTWRCPRCGRKGYWRNGVGFDHQKRCEACDLSWEPGELIEVREAVNWHLDGCWALDLLLGKE